MKWRLLRLLPIGAFVFCGSFAVSLAEHAHDREHSAVTGDDATVHHRFTDAEKWASVFEDPERDLWQKPDHVIGLLSIDSTALVADIGSATGYFSVRFARAVTAGKVYAVDIESTLVNYLEQRAADEGLANLVSVLGEPDDPLIPEPVDLIFLCDTYHHIDDRVEYFHSVLKYLKPGGRLVVIDFVPGDLPVGPGPAHKLAPARVTAELFAAGYELKSSDESLPYQYILSYGVRSTATPHHPGTGEEGGSHEDRR